MSFVLQKLADILQRIYSFFVGLQFWYYWAIIKFVIFFIHFLTSILSFTFSCSQLFKESIPGRNCLSWVVKLCELLNQNLSS